MDKLKEVVSFWLREAGEAGACTVPPMGDQREHQPPGLLAAAGFSTESPEAWETSELGKPGESVTLDSGTFSEHY